MVSHSLRQIFRDLKVRMSFKHLHGPTRVSLRSDAAGIVLLAKNVEWFLPTFLEHHRQAGIAHFVVIDNGSSDRTLEIARQSGITLVQSLLPVKHYEASMRAVAARCFFRGGWVIFVDADEMLETPFGAPLSALLSYCNNNGFTAVLGQMLDLYSPENSKATDYQEAIRTSSRYSLAQLDKIDYHDSSFELNWFLRANLLEDSEVKLLSGGLRREVFGEVPLLTKHSLVRNLPNISVMTHPHCASGVKVADVTLALRHYKITGDWLARDRASVESMSWLHRQDFRRVQVAEDPNFKINPIVSNEWSSTLPLFDAGFLYASQRARSALVGSKAID